MNADLYGTTRGIGALRGQAADLRALADTLYDEAFHATGSQAQYLFDAHARAEAEAQRLENEADLLSEDYT